MLSKASSWTKLSLGSGSHPRARQSSASVCSVSTAPSFLGEPLPQDDGWCVVVGDAASDEGCREDPVECSVCCDIIKPFDAALWLKSCTHTFHDSCLREWLLHCESCPNCRAPAGLNTVVVRSPLSANSLAQLSIATEPMTVVGGLHQHRPGGLRDREAASEWAVESESGFSTFSFTTARGWPAIGQTQLVHSRLPASYLTALRQTPPLPASAAPGLSAVSTPSRHPHSCPRRGPCHPPPPPLPVPGAPAVRLLSGRLTINVPQRRSRRYAPPRAALSRRQPLASIMDEELEEEREEGGMLAE